MQRGPRNTGEMTATKLVIRTEAYPDFLVRCGLHRKSGGARWRDCLYAGPHPPLPLPYMHWNLTLSAEVTLELRPQQLHPHHASRRPANCSIWGHPLPDFFRRTESTIEPEKCS